MKQAVILAAGEGQRLRPFTVTKPKAMLSIADKPILQYVIEALAQKYNLSLDEIAYIGDDINDLEVLRQVGWSFAPSDAIDEVKKAVTYVVSRRGGEGAVREAIELVLQDKARSNNAKR